MAKVRFKYAIPDYYKYWVYKQKTIDCILPTNEYGVVLIGTLERNIEKYIIDILEINNSRLINFEILQEKSEKIVPQKGQENG